jgi:hypothetical protein
LRRLVPGLCAPAFLVRRHPTRHLRSQGSAHFLPKRRHVSRHAANHFLAHISPRLTTLTIGTCRSRSCALALLVCHVVVPLEMHGAPSPLGSQHLKLHMQSKTFVRFLSSLVLLLSHWRCMLLRLCTLDLLFSFDGVLWDTCHSCAHVTCSPRLTLSRGTLATAVRTQTLVWRHDAMDWTLSFQVRRPKS